MKEHPRLLKLMQWVACLSPGEARACLQAYRDGFPYSSEAVNQYGGTRKVIQDAVRMRNTLKVVQHPEGFDGFAITGRATGELMWL